MGDAEVTTDEEPQIPSTANFTGPSTVPLSAGLKSSIRNSDATDSTEDKGEASIVTPTKGMEGKVGKIG